MRRVREIKDVPSPGDRWQLTVRGDAGIVFEIDVKTAGRSRERSP